MKLRLLAIAKLDPLQAFVFNMERKPVMFTLDKNVVAITTKGKDSVDLVFDDIIRSVKIKHDRERHMRNY